MDADSYFSLIDLASLLYHGWAPGAISKDELGDPEAKSKDEAMWYLERSVCWIGGKALWELCLAHLDSRFDSGCTRQQAAAFLREVAGDGTEFAKVMRQTALDAAEVVRKGWTQDTDARDCHGKPVRHDSCAACRWSLYGALLRAAPSTLYAWRVLNKCWPNRSGGAIAWNDAPGRTQAEVVALLEQVAAELEVGDND